MKTQSSYTGGFSESQNLRTHKYSRPNVADSDGFNIKDLVRRSYQHDQILEEPSVDRVNSAEQAAKKVYIHEKTDLVLTKGPREGRAITEVDG